MPSLLIKRVNLYFILRNYNIYNFNFINFKNVLNSTHPHYNKYYLFLIYSKFCPSRPSMLKRSKLKLPAYLKTSLILENILYLTLKKKSFSFEKILHFISTMTLGRTLLHNEIPLLFLMSFFKWDTFSKQNFDWRLTRLTTFKFFYWEFFGTYFLTLDHF